MINISRRRLIRNAAALVVAPAIVRPFSALAYDSPTVRFNFVPGTFGETTQWTWTNEQGVAQGTATGQAYAAPNPPTIPDPLTTMFQAAIDYAVSNALRLEVVGSAYGQSSISFLSTWSTIVFPAYADTEILLREVIWLMRPSDGGPGATFDSSELWNFAHVGGEMLYRGGQWAVLLNPQTRAVVDSNLAINSAYKLKFASITTQSGGYGQTVGTGTAYGCLGIYTTNPIFWNWIEHGQISGNGVGEYGICVSEPPVGSRFHGNRIVGSYIMGCTQGNILIGQTGVNAAAMSGNRWEETELIGLNNSVTCFNTFGQGDIIDIPTITGPAFRGMCLEPTSKYNHYRVAQTPGCTTGILDAGTGNVPG
jgi:hypothetical protein